MTSTWLHQSHCCLQPWPNCGQWGAERSPRTRSAWLNYFPRKHSGSAFNEKPFNLKQENISQVKNEFICLKNGELHLPHVGSTSNWV